MVAERVATEFPAGASADPVLALVTGADEATTATVASRITAVHGVTGATVAARHGDRSVVLVS